MAKALNYTQIAAVPAAVTLFSQLPGALTSGSSLIPSVDYCMVQAEAQNLRFTMDGTTTPTATVGHLLKPNQFLIVEKEMIYKIQFIQVAASAILNITTFKGMMPVTLPMG